MEAVRVLEVLRADRQAAAVARGIDIILRTQVRQNGELTAWCAQHDQETLEPAWARAFEPPSLSGGGIVFREWRDGDPLATVEYGLRQPTADAPGMVPELILAPMVAFDRLGRRLGYGRGHYDRALAAITAGEP